MLSESRIEQERVRFGEQYLRLNGCSYMTTHDLDRDESGKFKSKPLESRFNCYWLAAIEAQEITLPKLKTAVNEWEENRVVAERNATLKQVYEMVENQGFKVVTK